MKNTYRNGFLAFGLLALLVLCITFPEGKEIWQTQGQQLWGYLLAAIASWLLVYLCNARAFQLIIRLSNNAEQSSSGAATSFASALQLTISGFAFSYITPFGSGGAPYRVLELSQRIGTTAALSAVTLYSMTHVFSHFFLWTTAVFLFALFYFAQLNVLLLFLLLSYIVFFVAALVFFLRGYRKGFLAFGLNKVAHLPFCPKRFTAFCWRHQEKAQQIDATLAQLYQHRSLFWRILCYEYVARVLNSFEFYFIFWAVGITQATFVDALLVLAFSSFMGNILFFLPMQLGAREGGIVLMLKILFAYTNALGLYLAIFTRIREIFWVAIGVLLVRLGKK